jgi:ankyrin repeat protein
MNHRPDDHTIELLLLEKSLFSVRDDPDKVASIKAEVYGSKGEAFQKIHEQVEQSATQSIADGNYTALFHAVINNYVVMFAVLVRLGANMFSTDSKGRGIIHLCTSRQMVRLLVDYGVDVHQRSTGGDTALHNVSHVAAAEELIAMGLSVNARNNAQSTPLHHALDPKLARLFLKHNADPNALNYYSYSPLHLVASRGIWEVVYFLLCAGCRVGAQGGDGFSAVSENISISPLV